MTAKKAQEKNEDQQAPTVDELNAVPAGEPGDHQDILEEFYRTHRLPSGYAFNATWPDKIRKVS